MIDEEVVAPPEDPAPAPAPAESVPSEAVPEPTAPPMEVISVDELLGRLGDEVQETEAPVEETPLPEETVVPTEPMIYEVSLSAETWDKFQAMTAPTPVPNFLEVPFTEYSVTDGLLLLLLVGFFITGCCKLLKEVF